MTQVMALSYTSAASGSSGSTASLTGPVAEVKLWSNKKEQAMYESYAGEHSGGCPVQVQRCCGVWVAKDTISGPSRTGDTGSQQILSCGP